MNIKLPPNYESCQEDKKSEDLKTPICIPYNSSSEIENLWPDAIREYIEYRNDR